MACIESGKMCRSRILHPYALGRNAPFGTVKAEFCPFGRSGFAGRCQYGPATQCTGGATTRRSARYPQMSSFRVYRAALFARLHAFGPERSAGL